MQEKIIEIIVYILNEIKDSKQLNDIDLKKLNRDGYTEAEINSAFAWIFSKIESGNMLVNDAPVTSNSHRFFHTAEQNIFTTDAMGYLIQMREFGIITDLDLELIIDKIFLSGYQKAGIEEVKLILSSLLFDFEDKSNSLNRLILQNNETIH